MIPGLTTRISETVVASTTSITQKSDLIRLTGNTAVATIVPSFEGFNGICILTPIDNTVALVTTGNIAVAVTLPQDRATLMVWSRADQKWYPGAIS